MEEHRTEALEGLGAPVRTSGPSIDIDPTLDACCRKDAEAANKANTMKRTLQRFDVVAARERQRRNIILTSTNEEGCKCCLDPKEDGGDYRALRELRAILYGCQEIASSELNDDAEPEALNSYYNKEEKKEDETDSEDEFDYLLDEDIGGETLVIEANRRAELEEELLHREWARHHGYGVHRQMHPQRIMATAFGSANVPPPPACVVHLIDDSSQLCASLDLYLEQLGLEFGGTKFCRSLGKSTLSLNREACDKFLPRVRPHDLPVLVAVKDGVAVNTTPLSVFGYNEVTPDAVKQWLDYAGVLQTRLPPMDELCNIPPDVQAYMDLLAEDMNNLDVEEERFECGVPGCCKQFRHSHVGIANDESSGLVVDRQTIIDG